MWPATAVLNLAQFLVIPLMAMICSLGPHNFASLFSVLAATAVKAVQLGPIQLTELAAKLAGRQIGKVDSPLQGSCCKQVVLSTKK